MKNYRECRTHGQNCTQNCVLGAYGEEVMIAVPERRLLNLESHSTSSTLRDSNFRSACEQLKICSETRQMQLQSYEDMLCGNVN